MPYKKFAKRRYKKKPFRKFRKSYRKKKTGYDGVVYNKCSGTYPIKYFTTGGAYYIIGWGVNGTSSDNYQYIDDNAEFALLKGTYSQWRLHGMRYKYIPIT